MEWYWCETCQDVKQVGYDIEVWREMSDRILGPRCKKCATLVEPHETYDCPIHGTAAPDGAGNCGKC